MVLPKKHLQIRRGEKRAQIPMTAPLEAKIALQLHAESMTETVYSERKRKTISISDANLDLLYRNRVFLSYLPKAREIINDKQGTTSEGGPTTDAE